jgi:hypothetical protein
MAIEVLGTGTGSLNLTCMGWESVELADQTHTAVDMVTTVQVLVATYLESLAAPSPLMLEGDCRNLLDRRMGPKCRDHFKLGT